MTAIQKLEAFRELVRCGILLPDHEPDQSFLLRELGPLWREKLGEVANG